MEQRLTSNIGYGFIPFDTTTKGNVAMNSISTNIQFIVQIIKRPMKAVTFVSGLRPKHEETWHV
jgi:hypothetical protein